MNTINYYPTNLDRKHELLTQIVFTEPTTLEDFKDQSRSDCIQLFSQQLGNFSHYKIFLGMYSEFEDYLIEECNEDLENGYVGFTKDMLNLNITTLKKYLKSSENN